MINNFDGLFCILDGIKIWGIGPVSIIMICHFALSLSQIEPEQTILACWRVDGWKHCVAMVDGHEMAVAPDPGALRVLPADQVEDWRCAYRTFLNPKW
jgi:hypothetical protein